MAPRKKTKPTDEIIRLSNVFVVAGVRDIVDREVKSLIAKFIGIPKNGNKIEFIGKDTSVDEMFEALTSKNLFMSKKAIILHAPTVEQRKFIVDNIVRISGFKNSYLIIVAPELSKDDKKQVFWSTFIEFGNFIECMPAVDQYGRPNQDQIRNIQAWLIDGLKARGLSISDRAIGTMMLLCNYKLGLLEAELHKMWFYGRTSNGVLDDAEVVGIVGNNMESSVFVFRDQLESGRVCEALKTMALLMNADSFKPDEFIRMLQNRVKDLAIIKSYMNMGCRTENDIAASWKTDLETYQGKGVVPHPYVIKLAIQAAQFLTTQKISELEAQLLDIEMNHRGYDSAKYPAHLMLTDFVLNYCKVISGPTFRM